MWRICFWSGRFFSILVLAVVSGCGGHGDGLPGVSTPYFSSRTHEGMAEKGSWWSYKFKISWPRDEKADFTVDLLLGHAVAAPAILGHRQGITSWRFHRRASEDKAGHQFNLLIFADVETAAAVFAHINENRILQAALASGLVENVIPDDLSSAPGQPYIGDTSDESWSKDLQNNWPSFIMGVSALWLGLIDDIFAGVPADYADIGLLLDQYGLVEQQIDEIWRKEGNHAFFHHLNAIFGYQPLLMRF